MTKFIVASALMAASMWAQAAVHLTTDSPLTSATLGANHDRAVYQGSTVDAANLFVSDPAKVTYTFEFKEASFNNRFFSRAALVFSNAATAAGTTFTTIAGAGLLDFSFGINSAVASLFNGANSADEPNFGILFKSTTDAVLFLNDTGANKDHDWDDMIVKVHVEAIPEPGSWMMLLAGIGVLGLLARRRTHPLALI